MAGMGIINADKIPVKKHTLKLFPTPICTGNVLHPTFFSPTASRRSPNNPVLIDKKNHTEISTNASILIDHPLIATQPPKNDVIGEKATVIFFKIPLFLVLIGGTEYIAVNTTPKNAIIINGILSTGKAFTIRIIKGSATI